MISVYLLLDYRVDAFAALRFCIYSAVDQRFAFITIAG